MRWKPSISDASSNCSGRAPTTRPAGPPWAETSSRASPVSGTSPKGSRKPMSVAVARKKFIDGEPMKPATNRFAGVA